MEQGWKPRVRGGRGTNWIGRDATLIPGFPLNPQGMTGPGGATALPSPGRGVSMAFPFFLSLTRTRLECLLSTLLTSGSNSSGARVKVPLISMSAAGAHACTRFLVRGRPKLHISYHVLEHGGNFYRVSHDGEITVTVGKYLLGSRQVGLARE